MLPVILDGLAQLLRDGRTLVEPVDGRPLLCRPAIQLGLPLALVLTGIDQTLLLTADECSSVIGSEDSVVGQRERADLDHHPGIHVREVDWGDFGDPG